MVDLSWKIIKIIEKKDRSWKCVNTSSITHVLTFDICETDSVVNYHDVNVTVTATFFFGQFFFVWNDSDELALHSLSILLLKIYFLFFFDGFVFFHLFLGVDSKFLVWLRLFHRYDIHIGYLGTATYWLSGTRSCGKHFSIHFNLFIYLFDCCGFFSTWW